MNEDNMLRRSARQAKPTARMAEYIESRRRNSALDSEISKVEEDIKKLSMELEETMSKLHVGYHPDNEFLNPGFTSTPTAMLSSQPRMPFAVSQPPHVPPAVPQPSAVSQPSRVPLVVPQQSHTPPAVPQPSQVPSVVLQQSRMPSVVPQPPVEPVEQGNSLIDAFNYLAEVLANKQERLPKMEPDVFAGDLISFPTWLRSFETLIEANSKSEDDKLHYLGRYTSGEAKNCIKGYFVLSGPDTYERAKGALVARYGDKFKLGETFRQQITNWPHINPGDGRGLQKLSDFLQHCSTAMLTIQNLQCLNNPEEICKITAKLPRYIAERWSRIVDGYLYGEHSAGHYPPFCVFCDFISTEARISCGPGVRSYYERSKPKSNAKVFSTTAATSTASTDSIKTPKCHLCSGEHRLGMCERFKGMELDARRTFLSSKGLCFSCLNKGHLRRDCKRQGRPLLYSGLPPRQSQPEQKGEPTKEVQTSTVNSENEATERKAGSFIAKVDKASETLHSLIVPVTVYHTSNPQQRLNTYAMLDNQSNACFLGQSLAEELNAPSVEVNLKLTTMADKRVVPCDLINGLVIKGINEEAEVELPGTYTKESIPVDSDLIPRKDTMNHWPHLRAVAEKLVTLEQKEVGLLIGFNCSAALLPRKIMSAGDSDPYAIRTVLGWGVTGNMVPLSERQNETEHHFAFRTHAQEVNAAVIGQMYDHEFIEEKPSEKISMDDRKFLKIVTDGIKKTKEGHYQVPLPMKNPAASLLDNKEMAKKRLISLKKKMISNEQYKHDYIKFMNNVIEQGYAEKAPPESKPGKVWYIPHHGVYHPKKKDKIRVVFDCSAECNGEALNKHLLSGPDLMNNLAGVLCRFRRENVAIACDVESMFHQVHVPRDQRDLLRFLWFEDDDLNTVAEYRMTVHLFGAVSSPGCVNFALKETANAQEETYGVNAANFVRKDFYMDDGLTSVSSVDEAKQLLQDTKNLCAEGGFKLHKIICNKKEVLESLPKDLWDKSVQCVDLNSTHVPNARTLGIEWSIEDDVFQFTTPSQYKDFKVTRRGILSAVSSMFDPLGLISPVLLTGRLVLQTLCRDGLTWDDPIPSHLEDQWQEWVDDLQELKEIKIPRSFKRNIGNDLRCAELHHFSDASLTAYGVCSYLRLVDTQGKVTSTLVMAKSRVNPSKPITVPRLELTGAVLATKVAEFLDREFSYDGLKIEHTFWTDSKVTLGYINNDSKRFHMFVANRIQRIRSFSDPSQWKYIESKDNPADIASRGMSAEKLAANENWWKGPSFLSQQTIPTIQREKFELVSEDDPEVRVLTVSAQELCEFDLLQRLERFSDWHRAKRAVAAALRLKQRLKNHEVKLRKGKSSAKQYITPNVQELQAAEICILKAVQEKAFPKEKRSTKGSSLYKLDPVHNKDGLVHVGGRIRKSNLCERESHPIVLPKDGHITNLIIRYFHNRMHHAGRGTTLCEIRKNGFWIVQARSRISSYIKRCVTCKRLRGCAGTQKMADLPEDRVTEAPPFTSSGVDIFGPFYVKEGRSVRKRWGALFTCMASRAVHIEVVHTLSTDSFLNAYRRFVGRRGCIRTLRCDQGTNFVGAKGELLTAFEELDFQKIQRELAKDSCDLVEFKMNVPHASHMGGTWERLIRSVRNTLAGILAEHGSILNDEALETFLVEAECVVNSRPLTFIEEDNCTISPQQLLTLRSTVVQPLPGKFVKEDVYSRKWWRRVQFLANQFWHKWRRDYLPTLQERSKWNKTLPDILVGDIVLMIDEQLSRCNWPLARVLATYPSDDGLVRKVRIATATSSFDRPITKLIFLFRPDPDEEPVK